MAGFYKGRITGDNFSEKIVVYVIGMMMIASFISFIGITQSKEDHMHPVKELPQETKEKQIENDTLKKIVDQNQPEISKLLGKAIIEPPKEKIVVVKIRDTVVIKPIERVPGITTRDIAARIDTQKILSVNPPNKRVTFFQKINIFKRKKKKQ